jgi:hypothetical protein
LEPALEIGEQGRPLYGDRIAAVNQEHRVPLSTLQDVDSKL